MTNDNVEPHRNTTPTQPAMTMREIRQALGHTTTSPNYITTLDQTRSELRATIKEFTETEARAAGRMSARDNILKHYGAGSPTLAYLLDRYRSEVLTEAARLLEDTGRDDDAVNLLDNLASHETPGQDNAPAPENTPLSPEREAERVQGLIYEAITAFQQTAHLSSLQHAQMRGYLAEHLAPVVAAEVDRVRAALNEAEEDLTGANLARWEEEQENRRLRLALRSAQRGRRKARARVAELEQQTTTARIEAIADVGDWLDEIGQKDAAHLVYTCDIPAARDMKTVPQQDDATEGGEQR